MAPIYTPADVKEKFAELDKDGDGTLSFEELRGLLTDRAAARGSQMTDDEVRVLWTAMDHDKDGKIDFDEFVDFVFSQAGDQSTTDWQAAKKTFEYFAGEGGHMDVKGFVRMCRQCELFDGHHFDVRDCDALFKKVHDPSGRGITFKEYKQLIKAVAKKKHCPLKTSVAWMASVVAAAE